MSRNQWLILFNLLPACAGDEVSNGEGDTDAGTYACNTAAPILCVEQ